MHSRAPFLFMRTSRGNGNIPHRNFRQVPKQCSWSHLHSNLSFHSYRGPRYVTQAVYYQTNGSHLQFFIRNALCIVAARSAHCQRTQRLVLLSTSKFQSEGAQRVAMSRDNPLFTLLLIFAVCLHTVKLHICMLWLTMVLQKPAVARRTIAIELLRRLDQIEGHKRRSQSASAHPRFNDSMHERKPFVPMQHDSRGRLQITPTATLRPRLPKQTYGAGAATDLPATPNNLTRSYGARSRQLATCDVSEFSSDQKSNCTESTQSLSTRDIWTTSSFEPLRDSSGLRLQVEPIERETITATGAEPTPPASPAKGIGLLDAHNDGCECSVTRQPGDSQQLIAERARHTPPMSASDSAAAFTEGYRLSISLSSKPAANLEDDTVEGAIGNEFDSPSRTLVNTTEGLFSAVDEIRHSEHRRNISIDLESSAKKKTSSVTLRARSKTNRGLLKFKASASRPKEPVFSRMHRRGVSINLPIRTKSLFPGGGQHAQVQPSAPSAPVPQVGSDETDIAIKIEQELYYKYRHIFVGTASLYSFLEILETSTLGLTSKKAVMRAFIILASKEQLVYRQASSSAEDWDLVTRIIPDTSTFDCLTMARAVIGSISLQQFVDSIPFNVCDEVPIAVVVEAFKNASHIDAVEGPNAWSKARAFRKWSLSQSSSVD